MDSRAEVNDFKICSTAYRCLTIYIYVSFSGVATAAFHVRVQVVLDHRICVKAQAFAVCAWQRTSCPRGGGRVPPKCAACACACCEREQDWFRAASRVFSSAQHDDYLRRRRRRWSGLKFECRRNKSRRLLHCEAMTQLRESATRVPFLYDECVFTRRPATSQAYTLEYIRWQRASSCAFIKCTNLLLVIPVFLERSLSPKLAGAITSTFADCYF